MKRTICIAIVEALLLSACGTTEVQAPATPQTPAPATSARPINTPLAGVSPAAQEPTMEDRPDATPSSTPGATLDPAMRQLVAHAQADLAARRGVDASTVEVVEARAMTWPDPSLGCPQPGMLYKQVPVDGVLIRLKIDGTIFNYHGGAGRAPFLCEHPARTTSPGPGASQ